MSRRQEKEPPESWVSGPREKFIYTRQQMSQFGAAAGWQSRYIGAWNHPRQQQMFEYSIEG